LRAKPAGWPGDVRAILLEAKEFRDGALERNQASQRVSSAEGFPLFESNGAFGAKIATDKNLPIYFPL
jgi:hypothetical protein